MYYIMPKFGLEFELEPISKNHGRTFDTTTSYVTLKSFLFITLRRRLQLPHFGYSQKDFKVLESFESLLVFIFADNGHIEFLLVIISLATLPISEAVIFSISFSISLGVFIFSLNFLRTIKICQRVGGF